MASCHFCNCIRDREGQTPFLTHFDDLQKVIHKDSFCPTPTPTISPKMKNPRVILEPELQIQVVTLTPRQRRLLGHLYLRWARQLFVSARILERDAQPPARVRPRYVPPRKAALN